MSGLREKIAEFEHNKWSELMEYWNIEHPLIGVPYLELPESKKESDRYYADKAIAAFKAHIEGCEMPKKQYDTPQENYCFKTGVEAYHKALMESLEEEKG